MVHSQVQLQVGREGKILELCLIFVVASCSYLSNLLTCLCITLTAMQAFATIVGLCFAIAALLFFGLTILWA
jgi:hypothetical protein